MNSTTRRAILSSIKTLFISFIAITVYANLGPTPEPEFHEIRVPVRVLVKSEPDTIVKWREKIVYRTVKPTQVVTADSGAAATVDKFCRAAEPRDSAGSRTDPTPSSAAPALIRSGSFKNNRLTLFEAVANGDLRRSEYRTHSPFTFAERDGGILVQSPRMWWIKPLIRDAVLVGVGYGAGKVF